MIRDMSRKQNAVLATAKELLADPASAPEGAELNQLEMSAVQDLLDDEKRFAIVDGFLGDEWQELLREDMMEAIAAGALQPRDVANASKKDIVQQSGNSKAEGTASTGYTGCHTCWFTLQQLETDYPALHELAQRLSFLPYELNQKCPQLELKRPLAAGTLVLAVGNVSEACQVVELDTEPRAFQAYKPRRDGSFGESDNGYKISAVYTFNPEWAPQQGGLLELINTTSGKRASVEPLQDRLVLFRSRSVVNQVQDILGEDSPPRFSVTMFFNGPPAGNTF
jgi:hypothetical protein